MYRFTFAFGIVALMFTPALRAEIGIDPQAPDDPSYFVSDNIRYHHIRYQQENDSIEVIGISGTDYDSIINIPPLIQIPGVEAGYPVSQIDMNAFKDCVRLREVGLPYTVSHINDLAFEGCTALEKVTVTGGETPQLLMIGNNVYSGCKALISIPDYPRLFHIGFGAFKNTGFKSFVMPENCTIVPDNAFEGCTSLESFKFSDICRQVGNNAFSGCTSLTDINLGDTKATYIGSSAFSGCTALTSVTIPSTMLTLGTSAFGGCEALRNVTSYAVTAPHAGTDVFPQTAYDNATLSYPEGATGYDNQYTAWHLFDHSIVSSIGDVTVEIASEPVYCTIEGLRVSRPREGSVYVRVIGSHVDKVIVR